MNVTISVHIQALHVHLGATPPVVEVPVAEPADTLPPAPAMTETEATDEPGATPPPEADPVEAPEPEPAPDPEPAGTSPDEPQKRRRGRPRKITLSDEEIIAQANAIVVGGAGSDDGPVALPETPETPEAPEAPEGDATEVEPVPAAPVLYSALTGEVVVPAAPDAPQIAALRRTLRAFNYSTESALAYLTEAVGRPVLRLGELGIGEIEAIIDDLGGPVEEIA